MADGLTDINAAIAELQAQASASATSEEVEDINSTLEGLETDLDDLLASNNIFTGTTFLAGFYAVLIFLFRFFI